MVSRRCMSKPICPGWQGARTTALLGCFAFACSSSCTTVAADKAEPGLAVRFTARDSDKATATGLTVLPNVWLYVPAGKPPSPFLSSGRFSAQWAGFLSSELRYNYTLQRGRTGDLQLDISDGNALERSAGGT